VRAACKRAFLRNEIDADGEPSVDAEAGALLDAQVDGAIVFLATTFGYQVYWNG
jgi:hypothetical protein